MGRATRVALPVVDRASLDRLEAHFVSPEIYRRDDLAARQAKLARLISENVIPQLLRIHSEVIPDAPEADALVEALAPSTADIASLADIILGNDLEAAVAYVMVLRERGLSMDMLFLDVLEPTARLLGEMWDADKCDFVDVTIGVARLQKLLAIFNNSHVVPALDVRRNVLMAMTPGDQHYFGVTMVERFLLAAGWKVQAELSGTADDLAEIARCNWFAVAGFTMGSEQMIDSLRATIEQVRQESRNPSIGIMVGGPLFTASPGLAMEVGADATAPNAPGAVLVAQKLFDLAAPGFAPI